MPKKITRNKDKGMMKEEFVSQYLQKRGWRILHRNKKFFGVEIDILAQKQNERILVEVKSVKRGDYLEGILKPKQKDRLKRVAEALSNSSHLSLRLFLAAVNEQNKATFFEIS